MSTLLGTCPVCGQQFPTDMLNKHGECVYCATTLELWPITKKPKVTGGKTCRRCRTLLQEYVDFNIKRYGCPKCGGGK